MNHIEKQPPCMVKEEHSEIFTLRSINSDDEILELVPIYHKDAEVLIKSGHWSAKEHIKYIMFLDYFSNLFILKHNKKLWKIFTIMSSFIKTRNSSQCRSHHQKTQRKHKSVEEVLKNQKTKYKNYDIQFQQIKKVLQQLPIRNPMQVQKQRQTAEMISSLKVLQQNQNYPTYRNSLSMIDIDLSQRHKETARNVGSEKVVIYSHKKYIGSECSIQIEDQAQQHSPGNNLRIQNENHGNSNKKINDPWLVDYQAVEKQEKIQKLVKTTDSYTDQNVNKNFNNFVRMKKSRSSLPSFDFLSTMEGSQDVEKNQYLHSEKKQSYKSEEHKCKTSPKGSQKSDSQESWQSQKFNNHPSISKSLFSGFVSTLQSATKSFQLNQILGQQQYTSFNNLCNIKNIQNDGQILISKNKSNLFKQKTDKIEKREKIILFCDDIQKGNLCNQISDSELQKEDSFQLFMTQKPKFFKIYPLFQAQQFNQQEHPVDECELKGEWQLKNFTKKKSSNVSQISVKKKKSYEADNLILLNEENSQRQQSKQADNFGNAEQDPATEAIRVFDPEQYPLLQIYVRNFYQFYIYFLICKMGLGSFHGDSV